MFFEYPLAVNISVPCI